MEDGFVACGKLGLFLSAPGRADDALKFSAVAMVEIGRQFRVWSKVEVLLTPSSRVNQEVS